MRWEELLRKTGSTEAGAGESEEEPSEDEWEKIIEENAREWRKRGYHARVSRWSNGSKSLIIEGSEIARRRDGACIYVLTSVEESEDYIRFCERAHDFHYGALPLNLETREKDSARTFGRLLEAYSKRGKLYELYGRKIKIGDPFKLAEILYNECHSTPQGRKLPGFLHQCYE